MKAAVGIEKNKEAKRHGADISTAAVAKRTKPLQAGVSHSKLERWVGLHLATYLATVASANPESAFFRFTTTGQAGTAWRFAKYSGSL